MYAGHMPAGHARLGVRTGHTRLGAPLTCYVDFGWDFGPRGRLSSESGAAGGLPVTPWCSGASFGVGWLASAK